MVAPGSQSSDLFEPEDSDFIKALQSAVLPGDLREEPANTSIEQVEGTAEPTGKLKRAREGSPLDTVELLSSRNGVRAEDYPDGDPDTYGASRFGEFGDYMRRKRAKLQIQNVEIVNESGLKTSLFKGLHIYINGWTEPSIQDLRELIMRHGGVFHAYLDRKSLVTHILTCTLTPAKIKEFKYMKVVRPEWLVESARAGVLLPWRNYIFKPVERMEATQGAATAQKALGFTSQARTGPIAKQQQQSASSQQDTDSSEPKDSQSSTNNVSISVSSQELEPPPCAQPRPPPLPPTPLAEEPVPPPQSPVHYAAAESNPYARRVMADPAWRAAHTAVAPDFVQGYYANSRLHHLSTWKAELRALVMEAQERAEAGVDAPPQNPEQSGSQGPVEQVVAENAGPGVSMRGTELVMRSPSKKDKGKGKAREQEERVIMHCDFDCFFVAAGLVSRPHLRGKPVVVCHSQGATGAAGSTSEIASSSYEARSFGIKNGMSLQQARKLCPAVQTIPYEFEKYKQFSLKFYTILMSHADDLQAVSVDEALIEVTSSVARINAAASRNPSASPVDPAKDFAEAIRTQIKQATGCEVSIGIGRNILLARLATRAAKPAGSYHLRPHDLAEHLAPLELDKLHGFGYAARNKAQEKLGTSKLTDLAGKSKATLCEALGKSMGETLYNALRGVDERRLESDKKRKSVSCEINYGIRFESNEEAEAFIFQVSEEVARRLASVNMRGRSLTLKIMKRDPTAPVEAPKFMGHGICDTFNKQAAIAGSNGRATDDAKVIGEHAWRMLKSLNFDPKELRGIGIQIQKLESNEADTESIPGQARLPFKPLDQSNRPGPSKQAHPESQAGPPAAIPLAADEDDIEDLYAPLEEAEVAVESAAPGSKQPQAELDLPSFSQVDPAVFEQLPDDVRQELQAEYKRRSVTPATRGASEVPDRMSVPPAWPPPKRIAVKGTRGASRITRQLAPRSRPSMSPTKASLFAAKPSAVKISDMALHALDIDPEVFRMLPIRLQREQLSAARALRAPGGPNVVAPTQRLVLKPPVLKSRPVKRKPPPYARHVTPPVLKQRGPDGAKVCYTGADDVQTVIGRWVRGFTQMAPHARDVEFFAKWLVHCVDTTRSTDAGIEQAIAVMKWWLVLLRREWGYWEDDDELEVVGVRDNPVSKHEEVGRVWWSAFHDVKARMDAAAKKKFGGCLSLR